MPPSIPLNRSDALLPELDRHLRRREQGIPTLTVLAGPAGGARSLWRRWLDSRRRTLCTALTADAAEVARAWGETLAHVRDMEADAADFLGRSVGLASGELHARLSGKTFHERNVLLQELLPAAPAGDASAVCRCLLLPRAHPSRAEVPLDELMEACGGDPVRVLAALDALVPAGSAPGLLLVGIGSEWLERAARMAVRLCDAAPTLPVALTVERSAVEVFLRAGESQTLAMVREGLLTWESPSPKELQRRLEARGVRVTEQLAGSLARLAADGASDELVAQFGDVARELAAAATDATAGDRARSQAERFLFLLLEWLPETQGLFELNTPAEFLIHQRKVEVDFLSRRLRMAIEVDGYHHFLGPEAYRRDRRKDLALQQHGYLVLRFLAKDVVERMEDVRDTVVKTISLRRAALGGAAPRREDADGGA